MFDVNPMELVVLGTVAILVIPPKDLPKAMRIAGHWMGKARGVARQFRSGFDEMLREAELAEMEKKWREENARIMAEHPPTPAMLEGSRAALVADTAPAEAGVQSGLPHDNSAEPAQLDPDLHRGGESLETEDSPPVMVEKPVVKPSADAEPDLFADHPPVQPRDPAAS